MFTIDASVHINAMNAEEDGSGESAAFLKHVHNRPWPIFSPTLLLTEVTSAMARKLEDAEQALSMMQAIRNLSGQVWIALDESLAEAAARVAAERRVRGADAVYAAVASRHHTILVTRDRQQLERLKPGLTVMTPAEALARLDEASQSCE